MSPKAKPESDNTPPPPIPVFRDKDPKTMTVHERNLYCAAISFNCKLLPYCPPEAMDTDPEAAAKYTEESINFMKGPYRHGVVQKTRKEMAAFVLMNIEELRDHLHNIAKSAQAIMNEEVDNEKKAE